MRTLEAANPVCVAMAIPFPDRLWKVLEGGGGEREDGERGRREASGRGKFRCEKGGLDTSQTQRFREVG
ncbi:hypothetical protein PR202_gb22258 [Eleusine coracana subsp. coracana]|uniref:Uncharacterized protein n=1 Tax=Eleusine coracana subsp. coracana TaxID=191504 RepID=A0AAV5FG47_ELECO|nr:hypothetical protein PR202_gb22258 [Eleusine coracana subsp. coracana]